MKRFSYINEEFFASRVTPEETDSLLAQGWRHFGEHFYRYNLAFYQNEIRAVFPVRIRLAGFSLSKSQRRVWKKNQDLQTVIRPIEITPEKEDLFERHRWRFEQGIPDSLYDFLSPRPASVPCRALEVCAYRGPELLAASFFDVGRESISSIYGIFAPEESARGLGIFTMLAEIDFAVKNEKKFYYHGYVYEGNSFYDYKKRFRALEKYDWNGRWEDYGEED